MRLQIGPLAVYDEPGNPVWVSPLGGRVYLVDANYAPGEGKAVTQVLAALVGDGAPVVGTQTSNADIGLTLMCSAITVPTLDQTGVMRQPVTDPGGRELAAAEALAQLRLRTRKTGWVLAVTPQGGMQVTASCFRSDIARVWDFGIASNERVDAIVVRLTGPREPFWHGPTVGVALAGSSALLDSFDTAPSAAGSSQYGGGADGAARGSLTWAQVAPLTQGTAASRISGTTDQIQGSGRTRTGQAPIYPVPAVLVGSRTLSTPMSTAAGYTAASVDMLATVQDASGNAVSNGATITSSVVLTLSLQSGGTVTSNGSGAPDENGTVGSVFFQLPAIAPTDAITAWQIAWTFQTSNVGSPQTVFLTADQLRLRTAGGAVSVSEYGGTYQIGNVLGTDRAPVDITVTDVQNRTDLSTLVVYSPAPDAIDGNTPLVPLNGFTAVFAAWRGTFMPIVHIKRSSTSTTPTVTLTISQYDRNATLIASRQTTATWAPAYSSTGAGTDILVPLPDVQLPYKEISSGGKHSWGITATSNNSGDVAVALLMLDSAGQLIAVGLDDPGVESASTVTFQSPPLGKALGPIQATVASGDMFTWSRRISHATGPVLAEPAVAQLLLVYTPDPGSNSNSQTTDPPPTVTAAYDPRWLHERFA